MPESFRDRRGRFRTLSEDPGRWGIQWACRRPSLGKCMVTAAAVLATSARSSYDCDDDTLVQGTRQTCCSICADLRRNVELRRRAAMPQADTWLEPMVVAPGHPTE